MNVIPIWQMKYCTKSVLVSVQKIIPNSLNYIFFCADRNYTNLYSFNANVVFSKCKIISNGKIPCFDIPFTMFKNEGPLNKELENIREKEYNKFKLRQKKR